MYTLNVALLLIFFTINLLALREEISEPEVVWLTDFKQTLKESSESQKLILMTFTGSDWCLNLKSSDLRYANFQWKRWIENIFNQYPFSLHPFLIP